MISQLLQNKLDLSYLVITKSINKSSGNGKFLNKMMKIKVKKAKIVNIK